MESLQYQTIVKTYRPKILRYLTRLVDSEEAEDLTQEVLIKVLHSLQSFRGESKLSTWIYKIATNTALDKLRSASFRFKIKNRLNPTTDDEYESPSTNKNNFHKECSPHPDEIYIRQEMNKCIRSFIERLPTDYKSVVVLCELEGLKNREVAEILGCSLESVKIRLHRAKTKLKSILETDCIFYRNKQNELACDLKSAFKEMKYSF